MSLKFWLPSYPSSMSQEKTPSQRLQEVRSLIREKGLSRQDLALLDDIFRAGSGDLSPLIESNPNGVSVAVRELQNLAK